MAKLTVAQVVTLVLNSDVDVNGFECLDSFSNLCVVEDHNGADVTITNLINDNLVVLNRQTKHVYRYIAYEDLWVKIEARNA